LLEGTGGDPALWRIPQDNRRLVEAGAATSSWRALVGEMGGPWQAHFNKVAGKRSAQAGAALPVQLRWDEDWGHSGWSELGDDVRTRLGLDGIDLELPCPWDTPLGCRIRRITAPAWMLRGPIGEPVVADEGSELRYGRLGLRAE
jgi:CRISPR-associated endonuclease/helicase Cas3